MLLEFLCALAANHRSNLERGEKTKALKHYGRAPTPRRKGSYVTCDDPTESTPLFSIIGGELGAEREGF